MKTPFQLMREAGAPDAIIAIIAALLLVLSLAPWLDITIGDITIGDQVPSFVTPVTFLIFLLLFLPCIPFRETSSSNLQIDALHSFETSYADLRVAAATISRDILNPERMTRTSMLDGINQLHTNAKKFQTVVLANKSRLPPSLYDAAKTYIDALAELNESVRFGLGHGLTKTVETTERLNTSLKLVSSAEKAIDSAVQIVSNEIVN